MEANHSSLISAIAAASLITLLYLPRPLVSLLFSPACISSLLLLFTLFHFSRPSPLPPPSKPEPQTRQDFSWIPIRRGPLEVIYEEYEFDDDDDVGRFAPEHACMAANDIIDLADFGLTDSDAYSSDEMSTSTWEDDEEELIEISLGEEEDEGLIEIDIRL